MTKGFTEKYGEYKLAYIVVTGDVAAAIAEEQEMAAEKKGAPVDSTDSSGLDLIDGLQVFWQSYCFYKSEGSSLLSGRPGMILQIRHAILVKTY